ncbi:MAG: MarR family transcriptional regulator [Parachlamydiaceae bacterium]|nr:MarR family transcriptional regulator [Parachlamydiaceae bacterium]
MKNSNTLEIHVGYWLRFVSNHVSASFAKKLASHDVGVGEWVVLNLLNDQKVLSPAQIASSTKMTRGAVSKLLDRLYLKQFIFRVESSKDRRYQEITLSDSGKKLLPKLKKLADANENEFFGHLEKEQKIEIIKLLREIVCAHKWDEIPIK